MVETKETKEFAKQWIEEGKPCMYRYGFSYRGAVGKPISKDEALKLLPRYSFGMGFYSLSFCKNSVVDHEKSGPNCVVTHAVGDTVLMFNEFSENDMW